jgi:hypothetical protein
MGHNCRESDFFDKTNVAFDSYYDMADDRLLDAGAPEIEVTPEMIEAGIEAFCRNKSEDWSNPGGSEKADVIRAIYLAMWPRQRPA